MGDSYRKHLEAAKQKALAWTPESIGMSIFSPNYGVRDYVHAAVNAVIGIYHNAIHDAECEGCAVKSSAYLEIAPTEGYPHDNLPFHNVFEVDHGPGAQMLFEIRATIATQNALLQTLQTQRDAYKARLDALMKDGLIVDKTQYRIEFAGETEKEVRVRLIPIDHAD